MTPPLPHFEAPPVVETILGFYFRPIPRLTGVEIGAFWNERLRHEFPEVREQTLLEAPRPRFGDDLLASEGRSGPIVWGTQTPPRRYWCETREPREHVVQIQRSAVVANWLRSPSADYLAYEERKQRFVGTIEKLADFLAARDLGGLEPELCEVRYINHLPWNDRTDPAQLFESVFPSWRHATSDGWLPRPDRVHLEFGYPMPDRAGRLDVAAAPHRVASEDRTVLRLDLRAVVRAARGESHWSAVVGTGLDVCHEWVVKGFASLTDPTMHEHWRKSP